MTSFEVMPGAPRGNRGVQDCGQRATRLTGRVIVALHKPYGVVSQFTPEPGSRWRTLESVGLPKAVYPLGRLDADSEGLLLLTDEPGINARLLDPKQGHCREYWVQVEREPTEETLATLARGGLRIGDFTTRPCGVRRLVTTPDLPPRDPPLHPSPHGHVTCDACEGVQGTRTGTCALDCMDAGQRPSCAGRGRESSAAQVHLP